MEIKFGELASTMDAVRFGLVYYCYYFCVCCAIMAMNNIKFL